MWELGFKSKSQRSPVVIMASSHSNPKSKQNTRWSVSTHILVVLHAKIWWEDKYLTLDYGSENSIRVKIVHKTYFGLDKVYFWKTIFSKGISLWTFSFLCLDPRFEPRLYRAPSVGIISSEYPCAVVKDPPLPFLRRLGEFSMGDVWTDLG